MLLHTIEGVTDVIYFFSGCKEEREVAELHMLFLRVTHTSEYFHQFCCSWSGLFRWRQHCWARKRRTTASSSPAHTEAQRMVVAPWLRIKWNLSLATNMARVPALSPLLGKLLCWYCEGDVHIMDSWSPHAGLLSILVFNWFTDYCILHTLTWVNEYSWLNDHEHLLSLSYTCEIFFFSLIWCVACDLVWTHQGTRRWKWPIILDVCF